MSAGRFINDLFLVVNRIPGVKVLDTTLGGSDANIWESSWRSKGKRLLAYSNNDADEYVVTDLVVLPEDKDRDMDDYAGLLLTKDTNEKGLKKHIIYYKRDLRTTASKAIEQIIVINPSKGEMLQPLFTAVAHPINELVITFKIGDLPKAQTAQQKTSQVSNVPVVSNVPSPPTGIEGIPFQINPKYNTNQGANDPIIASMCEISVADIEEKYNYGFTTENRVTQQNS